MLYLIRGLPGTGKTLLAETLSYHNIAADDYFYITGVEAETVRTKDWWGVIHSARSSSKYNFEPGNLPQAHSWCLRITEAALRAKEGDVAVHNTFTCRWELEPYLEAAKALESQVTVIDLWDGGCEDAILHARNQHGVPLDAFERMRDRYEHDWKAGDPRPPWERT